MNFDFSSTSQAKPSTRDLRQFISPNPREQSHIVRFKENSSLDLKAIESHFKGFEEQEVAAVLIDTTDCVRIGQEDYLDKLREDFSGSVLRYQQPDDVDDLVDSRVLQFDGLVTPVTTVKDKVFFNWYKTGESMNFRVIPHVQHPDDWALIAGALPQFILVDQALLPQVPPLIRNTNAWIIAFGPEQPDVEVKCWINDITQ